VKPLIVGEINPYGHDERFALYPYPDGCAGERLCHMVMGLNRKTYLDSFDRVNLLQQDRWSAPAARASANRLAVLDAEYRRTYVLLGRKVSEAFALYECAMPSLVRRGDVSAIVVLPHPSGRNRAWNDPGLVATCRKILREVLPNIPFGGAS
jgi:hypothetical protein